MSAEEDTELRDLLVQTLENSGVLNKIKAELRAAVFLALEEQERVENKTPLVNESLKTFLNTEDGRLVAGLVAEFLQFFNLDFTLAVFRPETNTFTGLDGRDNLARELGIHEGDDSKGVPLLLEVIRNGQQKEKDTFPSDGDSLNYVPKELSAKHIAEAKKKFEFYDKDKNGEISKEELKELFINLFPRFHKNMLDKYVNDESKAFNNVVDFDEFLGMYKRLFVQCRSVEKVRTADAGDQSQECGAGKSQQIIQDDAVTDTVQSRGKLPEGRQAALSTGTKIPRYKGTDKVKESEEKTGEKFTNISFRDISVASDEVKSATNLSTGDSKKGFIPNTTSSLPELKKNEKLCLDDEDSFFDDPLPEQMKIYACPSQGDKSISGLRSSGSKKNDIQKANSGKNSDTEEDAVDPFVDAVGRQSTLERHADLNSKPTGGLTSLSDAPPLNANLASLAGAVPVKDIDIKGAGDEEEYYDDDFVSGSQRSDKTKSEVSIGEEIEEDISVEGDDLCTDDKVDDLTLDHTISHLSDVADYIEEVA
ncbi:FGFR1 oncogene partner isoform X2 [Hemiscyllium ocellatum]|uniref:FGFR1 oncogene partner isoform X2 n=1 Tax=Hemiscyllium ocellatum TaxID=170820 RepID=UPI0029667BF5|nr:FGFR1 oncogene partner isoform X2 [Hemiscyllium ocellatum]